MPHNPIDLEVLRRELHRDYEIQEPLGQGGFGTVFRAIQRSTNQSVALKVQRLLATDQDHANRVARFEREAKLCAALNHTNIVKLVDKGRRGDFLVLAFELITGQTLADVIARSGPLETGDAAALMSQVLDALDDAHTHGIVHRDLKPDNLMVFSTAGSRQVKVLDFGVGAFMASGFDREPTLTRSHEILGTPCYSAPEQLRGEPATPRSDIYAWGLVFVECLTGRRVMDGATVGQVFNQQLSSSEPPLPPALATHPLGAILRRSLAKSARERAHHAGRLLTELRQTVLTDLVGRIVSAPSFHAARTVAVEAPRFIGERRQATAICCSLTVSSTVANQLDVETLDAVQKDQIGLCTDVLRRFGGHVVGTLANRVLAVFGVPQASESDARRAARAALELAGGIDSRRKLLTLQHGIDLALRMGMHTGPILVDEYGGLSGPGLNVAQRLEGLALSGMTLASTATYQVLRKQLRFEKFEAVTPREEPHGAYTLLSEWNEPHRSPDTGQQTEFVGRDRELARLLEHWGKANAGTGHIVIVRGEAGIGKSRLVRELCSHARRAGAIVLGAQCLPEESNTALLPVRALIRQRFDLHGGNQTLGVEMLAEELGRCGLDPEQSLPILCPWLNLKRAAEYPASQLSPERQRELILEVLSVLLCSIGGEGAGLVVMEDLQWADPTTGDWVAHVAQRVATHRCLLVMTARPEFERAFQNCEILDVKGLDGSATKLLIASQVGGALLDANTVEGIIDRTDGIPLFIEEIVKALLEPMLESSAASGSPSPPVPPSLRDLLHGRLDRLGQAKETAQLASAIGREFQIELLNAVSLRGPESVLADVNALLDAGVLQRRLQTSGAQYFFRHALIRDVAWDSMLSTQRSTAHSSIAQELEKNSGEETPLNMARLAHHFEVAGTHEKAISYRLRAGQQATQATAYAEALAHFQRAMACVNKLTDLSRRGSTEIDVLNARGAALIACQGFGAQAVVETFTRSHELSGQGVATVVQRFTTLKGLWTFHNARAEYSAATRLANELLELAAQHDNSEFHLTAHEAACQTATLTGQLSQALEHAAVCDQWFEPRAQQERASRYGLDPWLTVRSFEAMSNVLIGQVSKARRRIDAVLDVVTSLRSPAHEAVMLGQAAGIELFVGSCGPYPNEALKACKEKATAGLEMARRFGIRFAEAYNSLLIASADARADDASAVALAEGLRLWEVVGLKAGLSWLFCHLAHARVAREDFAGGLVAAQNALDHCQRTGEEYGLSEAHRTMGVVLGDPRNPKRNLNLAVLAHHAALQTARQQGARWLELRAAYSLAEQIGDDSARSTLQQALNWFIENGEANGTALVQACQGSYQT